MYKVLNARAELFCQLDLLFFHVLDAVAVVICLRSLLRSRMQQVLTFDRWNGHDPVCHVNMNSLPGSSLKPLITRLTKTLIESFSI